jgi:serine/threonine protein kinase
MSETMSEPPAVAALLADQRERWGRGDCVLVEVLLQQHPALAGDAEGLLDLIYQEVYLRERRGEAPRRDEYLRRFPHLAAPLAAQFDVHQAIQAGAAAETARPDIPGYELLAEVGQGGMGRVFKARAESGSLVAVKVLRPEHGRDRAVRKRFMAEARAAAVLDHPHIVKVFAVGECAAGPYFVMELIDGVTLEEVVRRGPPEPARAVRWLIPMAEAVDYAHGKGIIHRDLKPANVLLDGSDRPCVMDFGMAKILRQSGIAGPSSTQKNTILGTPSYMPPEQAGDNGPRPGPYSDVYSLGAILYALLVGRPPFDEGTFLATVLKVRSEEPPPAVRSLRPEVPEVLEQICHRCLSKRPADRYQSARELADELRHFLGDDDRGAAAVPVALCNTATGEVIPLVKETTVVGRSAKCDLVLEAPEVSRRHCRVIRLAEEVLVEDLGSSQGTCVNGARVTRARLRDGDRLEIAGQVFQVRMPEPRQCGKISGRG